jgi:hypothetical protein
MKLNNILFIIFANTIFVSCEPENLRDTSFATFDDHPLNVSVYTDVSTDNSGIVQIAPYADGASYFQVNLGDGSEVQIIPTGTVINHVYDTGTYEIKVIAESINGSNSNEISKSFFVLSKCVEETEENIDSSLGALNITILDKLKSKFNPLGGYTSRPAVNPLHNLSNISCTVQQVVRVEGCSSFAGLLKLFDVPFNISEDSDLFTIDVYGVESTVELNILFAGSEVFNITKSLTKAGEWQKLTFDLSAYHGNTLSRILLYFDKGEACDNSVYYFDNIQLLDE